MDHGRYSEKMSAGALLRNGETTVSYIYEITNVTFKLHIYIRESAIDNSIYKRSLYAGYFECKILLS